MLGQSAVTDLWTEKLTGSSFRDMKYDSSNVQILSTASNMHDIKEKEMKNWLNFTVTFLFLFLITFFNIKLM